MKLIHTADWHLGNSMHDIDRLEESKQFLDWLKGQIVDFGAECLVVAGDIFDTTNPSVEARRLYFRFLASLLDTRCKNIVLVGGNHDSGALLDAPRDLLEALNKMQPQEVKATKATKEPVTVSADNAKSDNSENSANTADGTEEIDISFFS